MLGFFSLGTTGFASSPAELGDNSLIQVFPRWFDWVARAALTGSALAVPGAAVALGLFYRSDYVTARHDQPRQPVPFSHQHHVGELGIDCRYCHSSVEESRFAGLPPIETCMNCHEQIWVGSQVLEPVRSSWKSGMPIRWQRVHQLPGFVYFDHAIHVAKGVGCVSCHGRVDEMPLTRQVEPLTMDWCLNCHRDPAPHLRPRHEVWSTTWIHSPGDSGDELMKEYRIRSPLALTSCSTCHR